MQRLIIFSKYYESCQAYKLFLKYYIFSFDFFISEGGKVYQSDYLTATRILDTTTNTWTEVDTKNKTSLILLTLTILS